MPALRFSEALPCFKNYFDKRCRVSITMNRRLTSGTSRERIDHVPKSLLDHNCPTRTNRQRCHIAEGRLGTALIMRVPHATQIQSDPLLLKEITRSLAPSRSAASEGAISRRVTRCSGTPKIVPLPPIGTRTWMHPRFAANFPIWVLNPSSGTATLWGRPSIARGVLSSRPERWCSSRPSTACRFRSPPS